MDTEFARTPAAVLARSAWVKGPLRGLRAIFAPTTVVGAEHVASIEGPVVVASNHASHADTMMILTTLPAALRRRMVLAAAADYFFANRVVGTYTAITVGAIPVERDKVGRSTLDLCHRLLGEGWSLTLFPEGGRSPDGQMGPFKPGAAWIARRAGVPVVPVHLAGTFEVLGKGDSFPRRSPVRVSYGAPLHLAEGEDAKSFGRRVEAAVRELGGLTGLAEDPSWTPPTDSAPTDGAPTQGAPTAAVPPAIDLSERSAAEL